MKNFEIKNMGVHELKANEMSSVQGGNWWWNMLRDAAVVEGLKWMFKNMPEVEPGFYHSGKM